MKNALPSCNCFLGFCCLAADCLMFCDFAKYFNVVERNSVYASQSKTGLLCSESTLAIRYVWLNFGDFFNVCLCCGKLNCINVIMDR